MGIDFNCSLAIIKAPCEKTQYIFCGWPQSAAKYEVAEVVLLGIGGV